MIQITAQIKHLVLTAQIKHSNLTAEIKQSNLTAQIKHSNLTAQIKHSNLTAQFEHSTLYSFALFLNQNRTFLCVPPPPLWDNSFFLITIYDLYLLYQQCFTYLHIWELRDQMPSACIKDKYMICLLGDFFTTQWSRKYGFTLIWTYARSGIQTQDPYHDQSITNDTLDGSAMVPGIDL